MRLLLVITLLFSSLFVLAQKNQAASTPKDTRKLIQFSGVIIERDSLHPIPFTNILVKGSNKGTVSDFFGYFSFVAQSRDTVVFSAVGYRKGHFVIPDTLSTNKYSLIQVLSFDTVSLKEITVYPWPSKEQFKEAFLTLHLPDDQMEVAMRNMARAEYRAMMEGPQQDASLSYKYQMEQQYSKLYYAGQYPSINLLNPIAWAQFIQAWKDGKFKSKR